MNGTDEGGLIYRQRYAILFLVGVLALAGTYCALTMPASVFPRTDFPRVVILIDNGVMPADELMATVTIPVEAAMKEIPGTTTIRSATARGSAEINVFFDWSTNMVQAELYVLGRLAQIRNQLPATATFDVQRLTFSAFPALGISLTSETRDPTELWERARYDIYPRLLRIPGVGRIKLVGGRVPEHHVVIDPLRLESFQLSIEDVSRALNDTNRFTSAGMLEEDRQLYLTVVDNRLRDAAEIEDVVIAWASGTPVRIRDVGTVRRGFAPQFNIVTADGVDAVLFNIYGQPGSNTVAIADELAVEIARIQEELPPDMHLASFYDQSLFVRDGVRSVWESIILGLALSVLVLFVFLRSPALTFTAASVIPVTVLITIVGMRLAGTSFNLMTLGGIAAAIGLVIDDAIVVVDAIHARIHGGDAPMRAVPNAIREVGWPLVGSTLTPTVVFLPLAFLDGVTGVFFRALAVTMVFALLASLALAVTWTPSVAMLFAARSQGSWKTRLEDGPVMKALVSLYERGMRLTLRHAVVATLVMLSVTGAGVVAYGRLATDFLPKQDEGAFVLDYFTRPGTSLTETDRMLAEVERILVETPEVASFSRRTGARLALAIAEPNTGDFLVRLKADRKRGTEEVIDELRTKIQSALPALHTEFPGVLSDLIGDLTWSPDPVEIKLFSPDIKLLQEKASEVAGAIEEIPGVVDVNDGLVVAGPSLRFRVRLATGARSGLSARDVGLAVQGALVGTVSSHILQGDRLFDIRVIQAHPDHDWELQSLPVRSRTGVARALDEVAEMRREAGQLEIHREDLRQLVAVSARFAGLDMGSGIRAIKQKLKGVSLPAGMRLEYGGLYAQQQESFRHLMLVLAMALLLVYGVLTFEFHSLLQPLAIVLGAVLALTGVEVALWITGISLNVVSFLGAIIGVGIVAKNGILMLDHVDHLESEGTPLVEALVLSGRRRLRPVLMTSLTTFLGLLPLAYGVGAGADMLRPLGIAVIGALFSSLLLSLVATPLCYFLLVRILRGRAATSVLTDPQP